MEPCKCGKLARTPGSAPWGIAGTWYEGAYHHVLLCSPTPRSRFAERSAPVDGLRELVPKALHAAEARGFAKGVEAALRAYEASAHDPCDHVRTALRALTELPSVTAEGPTLLEGITTSTAPSSRLARILDVTGAELRPGDLFVRPTTHKTDGLSPCPSLEVFRVTDVDTDDTLQALVAWTGTVVASEDPTRVGLQYRFVTPNPDHPEMKAHPYRNWLAAKLPSQGHD